MTKSYLEMMESDKETKTLKASLTELNQLQKIWIDMQGIETGQRGYVISGNKEFLKPYYLGLNNIKTDIDLLNIQYNKGQNKTIKDSLIDLMQQKIKHAQEMMKARDLFGEDSADAIIAKKEGLVIMNHIRESLQKLSTIAISNINIYSKNQSDLEKNRFQNFLSLFLLLILISAVVLFISNRGFAKQREREKQLLYNTALLSNLYDPVITTDSDYQITSWNENAVKLFGYKESEVLGRRLREVLRSKADSISIEEIRQLITNTSRWNGDITYLSKDDQPIYANVSTSLVLDEFGKSVGTVSIIRDITDRRQAENELKKISLTQKEIIQSKIAELNKVFERTTDAFVSFDKKLTYVYVNEKAANLHHSTVDNMIGKNILDFTPQQSSQDFLNALKEALTKNIEIHNELNYAYTGQWFENWIYPDEDGVSVFYRDITTRKKNQENIQLANQKLEFLNERFELIIKATNDAIWDWDVATNDVWGNENYMNLIKNKPAGKSNYEYFQERMNKDDMKNGFVSLQKSISENKSNMVSHYRFLGPNNEWMSLLNRQLMLYDNQGKTYRILGAIQDITQQRKAEEQIQREKELSDVLINSLPGLFYMFNKEGKYLRWNKNLLEITGMSDAEMKTIVNPLIFVPEEQQAMLAEKISNVFISGYDIVEADLLTKSGHKIPYYFTGTYIKFNNEDCVMGVGIDISEKVKTQSELQELATHLQDIREEERGRIAREIHDELGQQLTGLKMEVSLINKKFMTDNQEGRKKMNEAISLIDDTVKTVRRISTQLRPGILDDLGLIAAMEWQCEEFQNRYQIETTFDHNLKDNVVNKEKSTAIFRILQESLTNILRHSKATKVLVELIYNEQQMILSVQDDGIGIEEEQLRESKSFGLVSMRERAQILGGTLQISGNNEKGTTITVNIPL